jgi:hypothetical protein
VIVKRVMRPASITVTVIVRTNQPNVIRMRIFQSIRITFSGIADARIFSADAQCELRHVRPML